MQCCTCSTLGIERQSSCNTCCLQLHCSWRVISYMAHLHPPVQNCVQSELLFHSHKETLEQMLFQWPLWDKAHDLIHCPLEKKSLTYLSKSFLCLLNLQWWRLLFLSQTQDRAAFPQLEPAGVVVSLGNICIHGSHHVSQGNERCLLMLMSVFNKVMTKRTLIRTPKANLSVHGVETVVHEMIDVVFDLSFCVICCNYTHTLWPFGLMWSKRDVQKTQTSRCTNPFHIYSVLVSSYLFNGLINTTSCGVGWGKFLIRSQTGLASRRFDWDDLERNL